MVQRMEKDILKELEYFGRICQILDGTYSVQQLQTWRPPTDIYETNNAVIVKLEVAGMNGDDFKISFINNVLNVHGVRNDQEAKLNYHCLEIPYGRFQARIQIPGVYEEAEIEARYDNGYLYIILPKVISESEQEE